MKTLAWSGVLALALAAVVATAQEAVWTGAADGTTWEKPGNWQDQVVPGATHSVRIEGLPADTVIRSYNNLIVRRLECSAALELAAGDLTLTDGASRIEGGLSVTAGRTVVLRGTNTALVAAGPSSLDGVNLSVTDGARLELSSLTQYRKPQIKADVIWSVTGPSSRLTLPAMTYLVMEAAEGNYTGLHLQATGGGRLELDALQSVARLAAGPFRILADGTNSVVGLESLVMASNVVFESRGGADLRLPRLGAASETDFLLAGTGVLALPELTQADRCSFGASEGAVIEVPNLVTYHAHTTHFRRFEAHGAGSRLRFPRLIEFAAPDESQLCNLQALAGGQVEMAAVTRLSGNNLTLLADGAGSVVDLSGLVENTASGPMEARNGGEIRVPRMAHATRADLILNATGRLELPALTNKAGGSLSVSGRTVRLPGVPSIDGAGITVTGGGALELPAVRSYIRPDGRYDTTWLVRDPGSRLALPALTNLLMSAGAGYQTGFQLQALGGGRIELGAVDSMVRLAYWTPLRVLAEGTNSLVDLTRLVTGSNLTLEAHSAGAILVPQLAQASGSQFRVSQAGQLELPALVAADRSSFFASDGAVLEVPLLESYTAAPSGFYYWQATGAGSRVSFPRVTQYETSPDSSGLCFLRAMAGGRVEAGALLRLSGNNVDILAEGSGSVVDLPGLVEHRAGGPMEARNGGEIRVPRMARADWADLRLNATGMLHLPALTNKAGGSISVAGISVSLPLLTQLEYTSISVSSGGQLELPAVTAFARPAGKWHTGWTVSGAGSRLSLPALTDLTGPVGGLHYLHALDQGTLELPALRRIPGGQITCLADGINSTLNLRELESVANTPSLRSLIEAVNGGQVLLGGAATRATSLRQTTLRARGAGSVLELSHALRLDGEDRVFEALEGGQIRLPHTLELGPGSSSFLADGAGSTVDLSSLVRFSGGSLEARNGGLIATPRLWFMDRSRLIIRNTGRAEIAGLRKLTGSEVTVDATSVRFPHLYHRIGTTFATPNGGQIEAPDLDLVLTHLTVNTDELWCGEPLTVSWQGTHRTGAAVPVGWSDAVFLSADDWLGGDDTLLAVVSQDGLVAGATYQVSTNLFVPGLRPGDYRLLVRTLGLNREDPTSVENTTSLPVRVRMESLTLGGPSTNRFLANGQSRYYQLTITETNDLSVHLGLHGVPAATELYLSRNTIPTRSQHELSGIPWSRSDRTVRVPGTRAGTYYLLAWADHLETPPTLFDIRADFLPTALATSSPSRGGNAGPVTLTLSGSGFTTNTTTRLVYHDTNGITQELPPVRTRLPDMQTLKATFDLTSLPTGPADVMISDAAGATAVLRDAFIIEPGRPEDVRLEVIGPPAARRGGGTTEFTVTVVNLSNQDTEILTLASEVPDHPAVEFKLWHPAFPGQSMSALSGYLALTVPPLAPGESASCRYDVALARNYSRDAIHLSWQPFFNRRPEFFAALATHSERLRRHLASQPDLPQLEPALAALASQRDAWDAFVDAALQQSGLLGQAETLADWTSRDGRRAPIALASSLRCLWDNANVCYDASLALCGILTGTVALASIPLGGLTAQAAVYTWSGCRIVITTDCTVKQMPKNCDDREDVEIPVVGSSDPNLLTGPAGWGSGRYVRADATLPYLVEFENQPDALAAAITVTVTNQLPPTLDPGTFRLTEIGFGEVVLRVPPGLNHYETRVPFAGWTWRSSGGWQRGETPLMIEIEAGINPASGLVTATFRSRDPDSWTLPRDPYAGFLPPNQPELFFYRTNANGCCGDAIGNTLPVQPGQGYFRYTVQPRTPLASGTLITNQARIVFDWNDPIDTPVAFNTVDTAPPVATVHPLPAESGRRFRVTWTGQDDPGGAGLASFEVYASTDGGGFELWQDHTSGIDAWFLGEPGHAYAFAAIARDHVGHESRLSTSPQTLTRVPTNAPVLAAIADQVALPGTLLTVSNTVTGTPRSRWQFALESPAPPQAMLDPDSGVLRWTPDCSQANTTHRLTVLVFDLAQPALWDVASFAVAVRDCVQPSLGRSILRAGSAGRVPVNLISSVALTHLEMTLVAPAERLTQFAVQPLVPELCMALLEPLEDNRHRLRLLSCPGQGLSGTQQVAWLEFTTAPQQASGFADLALTGLEGLRTDGQRVANFAPMAGQVVIVGEEPLLELRPDTRQQPELTLYGPPDANYAIEATPALEALPRWEEWQRVRLTNLFQTLHLDPSEHSRFYRARRLEGPGSPRTPGTPIVTQPR